MNMTMQQQSIPSEDSLMENAQRVVYQFQELYHQLDASNCEDGRIEAVYSDEMLFEDSFHRIEGVADFKDYCASLYENLSECMFEFHDAWVRDHDAMLTWTMRYRHPRINRGRSVDVEGSTLLRFDEKVHYHRDYFDGGQLLYENLPVLGSLIRQLKKRMV